MHILTSDLFYAKRILANQVGFLIVAMRFSFSLILIILLFPSKSAAQPCVPTSLPEKQKDQYQTHYLAGKNFYRQKEYAKSYREFEAALRICRSDAILFNAASALDKLGFSARAYRLFMEYINSARENIAPKALTHIKKRVKLLSQRVAIMTIELQPLSATIDVENESLSKPSQRSLRLVVLNPGKHHIKISALGYQTLHDVWHVKAGDKISRKIELKKTLPNEGALEVSSTPTNATIFLDNIKQKDKTPTKLHPLAPGRYELRLESNNKRMITKVEIKRGITTKVDFKLRAIIEKVEIDSKPSSAVLFVDGKLVGETPKRLSLSLGKHQFVLKKIGYFDHKIEFIAKDLLGSSESTMIEPSLKPRYQYANDSFSPHLFFYHPLRTPYHYRRISLSTYVVPADMSSYYMSLEAGWSFFNWLHLGVTFKPLIYSYVGNAQGAGLEFNFGDTRFDLGFTFNELFDNLSFGLWFDAYLPTQTTFDKDMRFFQQLLVAYHYQRFIFGSNFGFEYTFFESNRPDSYALTWDLYLMYFHGPISAQVGLGVMHPYEPQFDQLALSTTYGAWYSFSNHFSIGMAARISLNKAAKLLRTMGGDYQLMFNLGYAFR